MPKQRVQRIEINRQWCKACGICMAFCPKKVLEADEAGRAVVVRLQDCISCEICERMCPDLAVRLVYAGTETSANSFPEATA
jgi:2-oxoglutarate ferredoxin oxidoreductase subunit delta